jgi:hypothetical protein
VLTLNRLVPDAQDLLARDILPLSYATKLASVPADRQPEGLERCFRPLFGKEERRRDQLEPLAELSAWIEKSVRLDPRSEDAKVLLPELADQVAAAEQERDAAVLAVSTLHFHTDRSDPKPVLAKSWKPAEGKGRCPHARPAVIALGEGQGTFLHVCIAKKTCQKHWGNLTLLTGRLNSKVSNGPWLGSGSKREGLEAHDVLLLNRELLKKSRDQWTDEAIRVRTRELSEIIIQIWPVPPNHRSGFVPEKPRLRKKVSLADLITGGALEPGMTLFPRRKKFSDRVATLLPEGQVEVDGVAFSSPSDAASAIAGKRTNGWSPVPAKRLWLEKSLIDLRDLLITMPACQWPVSSSNFISPQGYTVSSLLPLRRTRDRSIGSGCLGMGTASSQPSASALLLLT